VRRVDVQSETIERYVREGMIVPDLVVPMSEHRTFKYFKEETLEATATKYGWTLIDDSNRTRRSTTSWLTAMLRQRRRGMLLRTAYPP